MVQPSDAGKRDDAARIRWFDGPRDRRVAAKRWCRSHRHLPVKQQHAALLRRINGHCNYFGVNGNARNLGKFLFHAKRAWRKWLSRRSQRAYLNWMRFTVMLRDYPLPQPRLRVQIWKTP